MGAFARNRSQQFMRLPVDRVVVTLALETGEALQGEVFLPHGVSATSVLDETTPFVPIQIENAIRLVSRATIATMEVQGELAPEGDLPEDSQRVAVRLTRGATIEGVLRWVAVADHPRTIDHLNHAARFLTLHGDGITTYVSKAHVAWVEEC